MVKKTRMINPREKKSNLLLTYQCKKCDWKKTITIDDYPPEECVKCGGKSMYIKTHSNNGIPQVITKG